MSAPKVALSIATVSETGQGMEWRAFLRRDGSAETANGKPAGRRKLPADLRTQKEVWHY